MRKEVGQILRAKVITKCFLKLKKEYDQMLRNCKHDVVIEYTSDIFRFKKCLMCSQEGLYFSNELLLGKRCISICGVTKNVKDIALIFELVERIFIKTALFYPNENLDTIVEMVKQKIFNKDQEFCTIAEELKVDYKKWLLTKEKKHENSDI